MSGQISPQDVDEQTLRAVFAEAVGALEEAGVDYALIGGLASSVYGRPRWTADIDFFVDPREAQPALEALGGAGFETEQTNPHWIFKARKDTINVDLIFWVTGDIYFDEEMRERVTVEEVQGTLVRIAPPEDLVVIKALAHDEQTPRHWHDALAIIGSAPLDWDYLVRRAKHGARRVLSLLVYAQSNDLVLPDTPIRALYEAIYEPD